MPLLALLTIGFVFGVVKAVYDAVLEARKAKQYTIIPETEKPDTDDLERLERYCQQIDGYTQLIKLLDAAYKQETDPKKKAAILSKQLVTMDRLDRAIRKAQQLDSS